MLRRDGPEWDRATVVQQKTGRPVQFEITEQTTACLKLLRMLRTTGSLCAARCLLGHTKLESTARYLELRWMTL